MWFADLGGPSVRGWWRKVGARLDVTVSRVTELRAEKYRARQTKRRAASRTGSEKSQKHEFWGSECASDRPPCELLPSLPYGSMGYSSYRV